MNRTTHLRKPVLAAIIAAAAATTLILTGCTDSGQAADGKSAVALPNTQYGTESQWVIEQLNQKVPATEKAWAEKMSPELVKQISAKDLAQAVNAQIKPKGPFTATSFDESKDRAVARLTGKQSSFDLIMALDSKTKKLTGIHFTPVKK